MIKSVISSYIRSLTNISDSDINRVSSKIKSIFGYQIPSDIESRTSDHPDYEKDKKEAGLGDPEGFISKDWKKIYLNTKGDDDFIAHEIGHFFDKHLGNGNYFSKTLDLPAAPDKPHENFARMISYVVTEGHSGGTVQTKIYEAVCDKLGIKEKVKPGQMKTASKVISLFLKEAGYDREKYKPGFRGGL